MSDAARQRARLDAEVAKRKRAEADREAAQFERKLAVKLARAGVQDVDYALDLMRRHLSQLDDAAVRAFDEDAWLAETRKARPALFEAAIVPAETAAPAGEPGAPGAGEALAAGAEGSRVNASGMNRAQLNEYLRSKGLALPHAGMPMLSPTMPR